jgi:hypothetical protein
MSQLPAIITPNSEIIPPLNIESKLLIFLIDNSVYVDYAAFTLMIFGTALLLWQYSRKINKVTLAILIALPLTGYAGSDLEAFHISELDSFTQGDNFLIFLSLTGLFGWLSHSFAFLYVAHKLPKSSIKNFLYMTAIGFVFFSLSYTVDVGGGSYPPYAANSFALFPISVFMVVFGIYGSALSLSQDIILRKRIIVGNLKSVIDNEEAELKHHSGLATIMEKDEIKDYLEQVMVEVQKSRKIQRNLSD